MNGHFKSEWVYLHVFLLDMDKGTLPIWGLLLKVRIWFLWQQILSFKLFPPLTLLHSEQPKLYSAIWLKVDPTENVG